MHSLYINPTGKYIPHNSTWLKNTVQYRVSPWQLTHSSELLPLHVTDFLERNRVKTSIIFIVEKVSGVQLTDFKRFNINSFKEIHEMKWEMFWTLGELLWNDPVLYGVLLKRRAMWNLYTALSKHGHWPFNFGIHCCPSTHCICVSQLQTQTVRENTKFTHQNAHMKIKGQLCAQGKQSTDWACSVGRLWVTQHHLTLSLALPQYQCWNIRPFIPICNSQKWVTAHVTRTGPNFFIWSKLFYFILFIFWPYAVTCFSSVSQERVCLQIPVRHESQSRKSSLSPRVTQGRES